MQVGLIQSAIFIWLLLSLEGCDQVGRKTIQRSDAEEDIRVEVLDVNIPKVASYLLLLRPIASPDDLEEMQVRELVTVDGNIGTAIIPQVERDKYMRWALTIGVHESGVWGSTRIVAGAMGASEHRITVSVGPRFRSLILDSEIRSKVAGQKWNAAVEIVGMDIDNSWHREVVESETIEAAEAGFSVRWLQKGNKYLVRMLIDGDRIKVGEIDFSEPESHGLVFRRLDGTVQKLLLFEDGLTAATSNGSATGTER